MKLAKLVRALLRDAVHGVWRLKAFEEAPANRLECFQHPIHCAFRTPILPQILYSRTNELATHQGRLGHWHRIKARGITLSADISYQRYQLNTHDSAQSLSIFFGALINDFDIAYV
ncbi:unnamed protein product [Colias eurytheme]|nr:unnamed protein product [Colias eurytheme]